MCTQLCVSTPAPSHPKTLTIRFLFFVMLNVNCLFKKKKPRVNENKRVGTGYLRTVLRRSTVRTFSSNLLSLDSMEFGWISDTFRNYRLTNYTRLVQIFPSDYSRACISTSRPSPPARDERLLIVPFFPEHRGILHRRKSVADDDARTHAHGKADRYTLQRR